MATYLLTWNPARGSSWDKPYEQELQDYHDTSFVYESWTVRDGITLSAGDRVFLMKLGNQRPRGIIASGCVLGESEPDGHWDSLKSKQGEKIHYWPIKFDCLLKDDQDHIFDPYKQRSECYAEISWTPQFSGRLIPQHIAKQLEKDWARHQTKLDRSKWKLAEEVQTNRQYIEGAVTKITINAYERDSAARKECIKHHGLNCVVCGINFEERYGELGRDFIHVHHLKPLSSLGVNYSLSPIRDLVPVCPNCHAMLHKSDPPLEIEQLKATLKKI